MRSKYDIATVETQTARLEDQGVYQLSSKEGLKRTQLSINEMECPEGKPVTLQKLQCFVEKTCWQHVPSSQDIREKQHPSNLWRKREERTRPITAQELFKPCGWKSFRFHSWFSFLHHRRTHLDTSYLKPAHAITSVFLKGNANIKLAASSDVTGSTVRI